jgi:hypothetical protein
MAAPLPYAGTICNISLNQTIPLFLGFGYHTDPYRTTRHALHEALTNFSRAKDAPEAFATEQKLDKNLWACDPDFTQNIQHLFTEKDRVDKPIAFPELSIEQLDISNIPELLGCPILPVRCVARRRAIS